MTSVPLRFPPRCAQFRRLPIRTSSHHPGQRSAVSSRSSPPKESNGIGAADLPRSDAAVRGATLLSICWSPTRHAGRHDRPAACPGTPPPAPAVESAGHFRLHTRQIGRAHVGTPVTNAHLVCSLLLEQTQTHILTRHTQNN